MAFTSGSFNTPRPLSGRVKSPFGCIEIPEATAMIVGILGVFKISTSGRIFGFLYCPRINEIPKLLEELIPLTKITFP